VLDLFSSVGGLALGAKFAVELLGDRAVFEAAVDTDNDALLVHEENLLTRTIVNESVRDLVDFRLTEDPRTGKASLRYASTMGPAEEWANVSVLIGGPPCQGHSTLNNRTRSDDPKNQLMLTMPAIAVALGIPSVVIENVPNVINDSKGVVQTTAQLFEAHGYKVTQGVMSASSLGWPQTRKRFFMVARLERKPLDFGAVIGAIRMPAQPIAWALSDLLDVNIDEGSLFNSVPKMSADNVRRVRYLFENDVYDLPDAERPKCHQGGHTYPAVYGRMHWDQPAPTITGGFMTPGRGRFIHPLRERVLTPHEAARVQGFPDWFDFEATAGDKLTRAMLGKWIGDAVPSILGTAAVLSSIG
jgi:DNA (cytosine-5)-methyltransferase 1